MVMWNIQALPICNRN